MTITVSAPKISVVLNGTEVSTINLDEWNTPGKPRTDRNISFRTSPSANYPATVILASRTTAAIAGSRTSGSRNLHRPRPSRDRQWERDRHHNKSPGRGLSARFIREWERSRQLLPPSQEVGEMGSPTTAVSTHRPSHHHPRPSHRPIAAAPVAPPPASAPPGSAQEVPWPPSSFPPTKSSPPGSAGEIRRVDMPRHRCVRRHRVDPRTGHKASCQQELRRALRACPKRNLRGGSIATTITGTVSGARPHSGLGIPPMPIREV